MFTDVLKAASNRQPVFKTQLKAFYILIVIFFVAIEGKKTSPGIFLPTRISSPSTPGFSLTCLLKIVWSFFFPFYDLKVVCVMNENKTLKGCQFAQVTYRRTYIEPCNNQELLAQWVTKFSELWCSGCPPSEELN